LLTAKWKMDDGDIFSTILRAFSLEWDSVEIVCSTVWSSYSLIDIKEFIKLCRERTPGLSLVGNKAALVARLDAYFRDLRAEAINARRSLSKVKPAANVTSRDQEQARAAFSRVSAPAQLSGNPVAVANANATVKPHQPLPRNKLFSGRQQGSSCFAAEPNAQKIPKYSPNKKAKMNSDVGSSTAFSIAGSTAVPSTSAAHLPTASVKQQSLPSSFSFASTSNRKFNQSSLPTGKNKRPNKKAGIIQSVSKQDREPAGYEEDWSDEDSDFEGESEDNKFKEPTAGDMYAALRLTGFTHTQVVEGMKHCGVAASMDDLILHIVSKLEVRASDLL
jgi:hypothetical protein